MSKPSTNSTIAALGTSLSVAGALSTDLITTILLEFHGLTPKNQRKALLIAQGIVNTNRAEKAA